MTEPRTLVHIATTYSRTYEASELLKTLRNNLKIDTRYTGPIERCRPNGGNPDDPQEILMFLEGDVVDEVERRVTEMSPAFKVSVEVWEDFNL